MKTLEFWNDKKREGYKLEYTHKRKEKKNRSQLLFKRLGSGSNNLYIYKNIYALYISEKKNSKDELSLIDASLFFLSLIFFFMKTREFWYD